jgi:hypothetical protein
MRASCGPAAIDFHSRPTTLAFDRSGASSRKSCRSAAWHLSSCPTAQPARDEACRCAVHFVTVAAQRAVAAALLAVAIMKDLRSADHFVRLRYQVWPVSAAALGEHTLSGEWESLSGSRSAVANVRQGGGDADQVNLPPPKPAWVRFGWPTLWAGSSEGQPRPRRCAQGRLPGRR